MEETMKGLKNFLKKAVLGAAVMMLGAACNKGVIDANDPDGAAGADGVLVETGAPGLTPSKALLYLTEPAGKELTFSLGDEAFKNIDVLWMADPAGIAKVEVVGSDSRKAVITPLAVGVTKIRVETKAKKGFKLDKKVELACDVTVTEGLSFDAGELLLFSDDKADGPALKLNVSETHRQALAEGKAEINWEVTSGLEPSALIRLGNAIGGPNANAVIGGDEGTVTGDIDDDYVAHFSPVGEGQVTVNARFVPTDEGRNEGLEDDEASCLLTVVGPLGVTVTGGASGAELASDGSAAGAVQFNASVTPAGLDAWSPVIVWESSNTTVVSLSSDTGSVIEVTGLIKGVSEIKAKVSVRGREAVSNVIVFTVRENGTPEFPVTDITLSRTGSFNLTRGNTSEEIAAVLTPANATEKNVTWKVEPKEALTIVNGADQWHRKFKAAGSGSAKVTVTSQDTTNGSVSKSVTVNITALSVDITGKGEVVAGSKTDLTAVVTPADAMNKGVTWSLQGANAPKAEITSGQASGTATITGKAVSANTVVTVRATSTEDMGKYKDYSLTVKPHTFTIKYNSNGGTGSISDQSVTYGSSPTLNAGTGFTKADNALIAWNTQSNGSGQDFTPNAVSAAAGVLVESAGGTVTLYAKWGPDKPITASSPGASQWVVPTTGTYTIEVWGAQGNSGGGSAFGGSGGAGGLGGYSKGEKLLLNAGDELTFRVGAQGTGGKGGTAGSYTYSGKTATGGAGGAGGGMTAVLKGAEYLIVAGGGGGGSGAESYYEGSQKNNIPGSKGGSGGGFGSQATGDTGTPATWTLTDGLYTYAHGKGGSGNNPGSPGTDAGPGAGGNGYGSGQSASGKNWIYGDGGGGGGGAGYRNGGGGCGMGYSGGGGGGYAKIGATGFASASGQTGVQSGNGKVVVTFVK
jgi:hypothetical protein